MCVALPLRSPDMSTSSNHLFDIRVLYSCDTTIRIHIHAETKSAIMTNEHISLEKYASHTLFEMVKKGLRKGDVGEASWRLDRLQHINPKFLCL